MRRKAVTASTRGLQWRDEGDHESAELVADDGVPDAVAAQAAGVHHGPGGGRDDEIARPGMVRLDRLEDGPGDSIGAGGEASWHTPGVDLTDPGDQSGIRRIRIANRRESIVASKLVRIAPGSTRTTSTPKPRTSLRSESVIPSTAYFVAW